ncbi:MAG: DEAD/DEAH box helicase, partial [bacterium]
NEDIIYKLNDLNIKNKSCQIELKDIDIIKIEIQTAIDVKNWANNIGAIIPNTTKFNNLVSNDITKFVDFLSENSETVLNTVKEINDYWPNGFLSDYKIETLKLSDLPKYLNLMLSGLNQKGIREHQIISRIITRCHDNKLLPFIEKIGDQNLERSTHIFKKRFYSLWIDAMIYSKPILSEFSQTTQLDLISKFRILDERITRLSAINLAAEPAQIARQVKIAHANVGGFNGVGILRKEMEKKKKLKPLRVLFNEIPQVLQALKPCFLMSPLSVSTFLKPGTFNFDVVIFDEASQLPTPEAIPSILRAKQVIVAGDSKQLPPTSFFRTNILDDSDEWDEQQSDELESLLDDCKASVPAFTETDLKWHYRSRNEGLINFSNHYYYNNQLTTFPTPFDNNYGGVILEYVPDGVWDRGGSRVNRKEARHTAELIVKHFKTEPEKSLGVVSLNSSQKEAIQEALEEELQQAGNKDLIPLMDLEKANPFFIKSLENVQGDERDVIMISIGYG